MTENELFESLLGNTGEDTIGIVHQNMKDVAFVPTRVTLAGDDYEVYGMWYSQVFDDLMINAFGHPLHELIKIRKEDLPLWKILMKNC